jgi:hypothetical protein
MDDGNPGHSDRQDWKDSEWIEKNGNWKFEDTDNIIN